MNSFLELLSGGYLCIGCYCCSLGLVVEGMAAGAVGFVRVFWGFWGVLGVLVW